MSIRFPAAFAAIALILVPLVVPLAHAADTMPGPGAAGPADARILLVLNRLAFGPTQADVAHVEAIGVARYIDEQLDPQAIPEPPELTRRLDALDTLALGPIELFTLYGPPPPVAGVKPTPDELKARRQRAQIIVQQAAAARILRALLSRRQLQEVMVQFWFNHFNVFAGKGLDHLWVGDYERQAIRPYALGKFADLLRATALHPAMLVYLDNAQNTAPGSPGARGKEVGLNENFAREVMELHTLGVDGGYTQDDVISLARIMTGWGLARRDMRDGVGTAAAFQPQRHDFSPKTFLGQPIAASGAGQAEQALDMLARRPATARHIALELAQYFVADAPPPALVARLAARFSATDGDIRAVLKTLFASPEFWASTGAKYRTPYEYVISAARAGGVPIENPRPLLGTMGRLGMPLYGCQTPDGYKDTEAAWLSPDATTLRISFATAFARGNLPTGGAVPPAMPMATAEPVSDATPAPQPAHGQPVDAGRLEMLLGSTLSPHTRQIVAEAPENLRAALILGSPDFMRR